MDWLEILATPMNDLSDGSGVWWERVNTPRKAMWNGLVRAH